MDPNVETDQPGRSPSTRKLDDGADYLRLMGQGPKDAPSTPAATSSIVVPGAAGSPGFKERRRSPRLQCSGSADFWPEGSDVRMWGTLTDISLHGCHVEMNNTFPLGTCIRLTLDAVGVRIHVHGTVRVSYPFLGMGICFSEIELGQQLQLELLLATLSGQSSLAVSAPDAAQSKDSTHSLADVDATTMLDALTQYFRSNQLLSRQDFYEIAKRARR